MVAIIRKWDWGIPSDLRYSRIVGLDCACFQVKRCSICVQLGGVDGRLAGHGLKSASDMESCVKNAF